MRKIDLEKEKSFENKKVLGSGVRRHQSKYYWAVDIALQRHHARVLNNTPNKLVLEIGCSNGNFAKLCAGITQKYCSIDISDAGILEAQSKNIPNSEFYCIDAHSLPFPDAHFDVVIVNSLLHHMDLDKVIPEISRVLSEQGLLIAREPLGTNPIFQFYRVLTPAARTVDEKPFDFSDLALLSKSFHFHEVEFFGFSNLASSFLKVMLLRSILTRFDRLVSKTYLRYFFLAICWYIQKKW